MANFGRPLVALIVFAVLVDRAVAELAVNIGPGGIHIGPVASTTVSTSTSSSSKSTTTSSTVPSSSSTPSSSTSTTTSSTVPSSSSTSSSTSTTSSSTVLSSSSTPSSTSTSPASTSPLSSNGSTAHHSSSIATIELVVSLGTTSGIPHTSEHTLAIVNTTTVVPSTANVNVHIENTTTIKPVTTASKTIHASNMTMVPVATTSVAPPAISVGTSITPQTNATSSLVKSNVTNTLAVMTTVAVPSSTTMRPGGHPPILSNFDCSNLDPGYYGNPVQKCDTKFYICVSRSMNAYQQTCPARLFFDSEMKICDSWIHIPDCSGQPRPSPIIPSNETQFLPTAAPVIDCFNLTDGNYPDPLSTPIAACSNRFFTCVGGREFQFFCPRGLFYDHDRNQCDLYGRVFDCSGNRVLNETEGIFTQAPELTLPPVNFDCSQRPDGYYVEKCDSVFYSCNGGLARQFLCPDGLVFDSDWLACEAPRDTFICSGTRHPSTERPTTLFHSVGTTTQSPMNCHGIPDGIYRDPQAKCSRVFYYCTHNDTVHNFCPGNLYYDNDFQRCDLWINIFDCSGMRPTSTLKPPITVAPSILPAVDFDCSRMEDGNYANPKDKCSKFFYICANMEAFQQYCPSGLYYDVDVNACDSWANIFVCSGITHKPVVTIDTTPGTTQKPEFDCSLKADGVYTNAVNACSGVYFRCVGSITYKFFCPGGLFYDATVDRCDTFDNVFVCSGFTRPASTSSTSPPSTGTTQKPPLDCRSLPDGDYPDPLAKNGCGTLFYTCSSGFAVPRECADNLFFDDEYNICDVFWNVPACTGSPRPITISVPVIFSTSGPALPFDCTKLFDGNYANSNCSGDFWSCVGGTTFQRRCPLGFVYDADFDDCEFPYLVPKCGGHRLTTQKFVETSSGTPPGGFSCTFLQDGNYVDPAVTNGCSTIYYTCANGMTTRVHCPDDLFYDKISDACNTPALVPACGGSASTMGSKHTTTAAHVTTTVLPSTIPPVVKHSTTVFTIHPTTTASQLNTAIVSKILRGNFTEIVTEVMTETHPATTVAPANLTSEPAKPSVGELAVMTTLAVQPTNLTSPTVHHTSTSTPLPHTTTIHPVIKNTTVVLVPITTTAMPSTITTRRPRKLVTRIVHRNFTEIVTERVLETASSAPPEIKSTILPLKTVSSHPANVHLTTERPVASTSEIRVIPMINSTGLAPESVPSNTSASHASTPSGHHHHA